MIALGIRYLTGYAVAASSAMPQTPEFPPHFGRVFMALASTYFETGGSDQERKALEWLEEAGAPAMSAGSSHPRSFVQTYVPVNDKHGGVVGRSRQARAFPTARLETPYVYLVWDAITPDDVLAGLRELCEKVTRIGHSSSLVQMWVADHPDGIQSNWLPAANGKERMRIVESGTLAYLERAFNGCKILEYTEAAEAAETASGKRKTALKKELAERFPEGPPESKRPVLTKWQGYVNISDGQATEPTEQGPFDPDIIVLRSYEAESKPDTPKVTPRFGLETTLQLTSALRNAAMKSAEPDIPEWLSGHRPDGRPSLNPHAAFFPLPFVGARYEDGHVMGMAIAVPRGLASDEARRVIGSLLFRENGEDKVIALWRGKDQHSEAWRWEGTRETRDFPPVALRPDTWTGPAYQWASVTPVVLHHYPKPKREGDVERIVLQAFESAGLPTPSELLVRPVSRFKGAGHVNSLPEFTEGGENLCRYQTHVVVRFARKVEGPVLVGRGRFRGYGLFRPIEVAGD